MFLGAKENKKCCKLATVGIMVKGKEIRGSARPIGGLEKASRKNKRKKNDSNITSIELSGQPVTQMQHP